MIFKIAVLIKLTKKIPKDNHDNETNQANLDNQLTRICTVFCMCIQETGFNQSNKPKLSNSNPNNQGKEENQPTM